MTGDSNRVRAIWVPLQLVDFGLSQRHTKPTSKAAEAAAAKRNAAAEAARTGTKNRNTAAAAAASAGGGGGGGGARLGRTDSHDGSSSGAGEGSEADEAHFAFRPVKRGDKLYSPVGTSRCVIAFM